ncbi:Glycine cleavage system T protein [Phycisphaerae bacterium RAS1]|nr:Glycine cleavage system T protein [Phycisphaerae bacterium RAS1]
MLKTALHDFHRGAGAKLVDFAGWEMPVVYSGIIEEHHYTREHCSIFDVSHMGRLEFRGGSAEAFLEKLCTRRIGDMKLGQSRYSHVCREDGGILDDVIVSKHDGYFGMVVNASNREKLLGWFGKRRPADLEIRDLTLETVMVAVQGPEAIDTMQRLLPLPVNDLKRYHFKTGEVMGAVYTIFRSGYTGEDGLEIVIPARLAPAAMQLLIANAEEIGRPIKPAGLGARDTLRMEAAMPLYGHELTEDWDSITAGQTWCVDLTKEFIGQPVLAKVKQSPRRQVAGFSLEGKRIARQGAKILSSGREVGVVTSGTQSPTLNKVIAMGLLDAPLCTPGTRVEFDLRGTAASGVVTPLPFYKRAKAS